MDQIEQLLADDNSPATRVLVAAVGDDDALSAMADSDAEVYSKHYEHVTNVTVATADALADVLITHRFSILHLLVHVDADGTIVGTYVDDVLRACAEIGVKLVIFASENDPDVYISHFKRGGFNLVMTIDRYGEKFPTFLDALLGKMAAGMTMPSAWVELAPQTEHASEHDNLPGCIVSAGLPDATFLR